MKKQIKKPNCPKCESKNILTRRDGLRWCRVCGHQWRKDNKPIR